MVYSDVTLSEIFVWVGAFVGGRGAVLGALFHFMLCG